MATQTTASDARDIDAAERSGGASGVPGDRGWRRALVGWLGLSLVLHAVAAHFSEGFYYADEHWQTLEFMSCYLGRTPCEDLPWEYGSRIRAWLQPVLYAQVTRIALALGVESPAGLAEVLRFVSSLVGWGSLVALALALPRWIERAWLRRWALIGLATLWYLPYLHARTSSENLGGAFLAFGLAALACGPPRPWAALATGALLGLAFELRFLTAFATLGIGCWAWWVDRWPLRRLLAFAGGGLAVVALGTALDSRIYGAWTFAPWGHYYENMVAERMFEFGGRDPWWYYPNRAGTVLLPVSAVLLGLVGVACVRRWRSPLVWALVPFVVAHSYVSHKTLRFLFPVLPLVPVLAAMALDGWRPRGREIAPARLRHPALRALVALCLAVNAVALAVVSLRPPRHPTGLYAHLHASAPRPLEIHFARGHPFSRKPVMSFYRPDWVALRPAPSLEHFAEALARSPEPLRLFDPRAELPPPLRERCAVVYASHPRWYRTGRVGRLLSSRTRYQILYRCEP